MATASDLQQLYIGYFGRAADQEGLNFWLGAINNDGLSLENVHAAFVNSDEYNAQYEGLTVSQKVAAVYQNVLGRAADTEGAAFWTKAIEDGTITEDQLIEGLLSGLSTKDAQAISNKIVVANYYTSAKGDAYTEASKAESGAIIKTVTDKLDTVGTALTKVGEVVGVSNAELATALNALQAAEKAQVEVAKAGLGDAANGLTTDTQILNAANNTTTGISAKAETALTGANGVQAAATAVGAGVTLNASESAAATTAKIKLAQDKATADVSAARAEVAKTAGLPQLVDRFDAQTKALADATAAKTAAGVELNAELAKFSAIDGSTVAPADVDTQTGEIAGVLKVVNGQLAIDPAYATTNAGAAGAVKLNAANDLLVDVKANLAAVQAEAAAKTALDVTGGQIAATASGDSYSAGALTGGTAAALIAEIKQQDDLNKAVEAYSKAGAAAAEYKAATDAVAAAEKAITDAATGLGYDTLDLTTGTQGDVAAKEVFFFTEDTGNVALSVSKGDVLYVGSNYKLGTAEYNTAGDKIVGGDNNALEVFFIQKGTSVDVVIEKSVFGSSAATPEVATITLTGTTVDKLAFDAQSGLVNFEVA
ncbi:DUF4214 domain-containing protein [Stutzerimonas balearica]|uniref:DUF4214 domain-containing protein n=1 Tax=Stutzerimonas balearica TaxID=74829 RepID=UPI00384D4CF0